MVRKVFLVVMIIGLVVAGYITSQDYKMQQNNTSLVIALDFSAVKDWSRQTGTPIEELLQVAKDSQITHVGLAELNLKRTGQNIETFADREVDISVYLGNEVASMKQGGVQWTTLLDPKSLNVDHFYLMSTNADRINQIAVAAGEKYGRDRVKMYTDQQSYVLEIVDSPAMKVNGVGFDPNEVDMIEDAGLKVVPRPINVTFTAEQLTNYQYYLEELFNSSLVIFAGEDGVLGNRINTENQLITQTSTMLYPKKTDGMIYGFIEMTSLKGDKELARNVNYKLARVHSISGPEWEGRYNTHDANSLTIKEVIERYSLAVNDRSVNVLYVRPFTKGLDFNTQYFQTLSNKFIDQNYTLGVVKAITIRNELPRVMSSLLLIGLAGALGILFLSIFKDQEKMAIILVMLGLIFGLLLIRVGQQRLVNKLGAFLAAVSFPVGGIVWGYFGNTKRKESIKNSLIAITKAIAISVIGGFYVHAFLATAPYMTSIEVFPMVKIALITPIFVVAFLYIIQKDALKGVMEFMKMKIQVSHTVIVGIAFVIIAFIAMRSGNNPIIPVTSLEIKIRLFLQSNLIARPRFKEFAIGYPLLILGGVFIKRKFAKLFIIIGTIGLTSVVNTFAHLHKPVRMIFWTTANGIIIGVVLGLIIAIVIKKIGELVWGVQIE